MYFAFDDPKGPRRDFTTADILHAAQKLVPMCHSQREVIGALWHWLTDGRAQSASFTEAAQAQKTFVPIELDTRV